MSHKEIEITKIWDAEAVAASGTAYSAEFDLGTYAQNGQFSLHFIITGTGTVTFGYYLANDRTQFVKSTDNYTIATAQTATSGTDTDGKDLVRFTPSPARFMKLYVTETGAANAVAITAWLAIQ